MRREENWYIEMPVRGRLAGMVDATSLRAAKRKILELSRDVDWMDVSLVEEKPAKTVRP